MSAQWPWNLAATVSLAMLLQAGHLPAQVASPAALPATPPTGTPTAPLAATAPAPHGRQTHPAEVSCANGQLTVHADNSSLNQILHAVAGCTGMRITGGVAEQRVFGTYGPAAPATVLATLIDGTGSNMLLKETAANQPAELILTPRVGGVTPPPLASYTEAEDNSIAPQGNGTPPQAIPPQPHTFGFHRSGRPPLSNTPGSSAFGQTPVPQPNAGSVTTSPVPLPQTINNVNGSPSNVSPTAGSYPTTDSVPIDSLATPSTTPPSSGIVDAPNPPPDGSDTAAALSGAPRGTPGTTNISPDATSQTSTPGATNTTVPAQGQLPGAGQTSTDLTPEQIFLQLQQRQQELQQQQQPVQQDTNPQ